MVAHNEMFKGVRFGQFDTYKELSRSMQKHIPRSNEEIVYLCVGTDRSTGDSLAPLIGSMLVENGYTNVIGTIDDPCHAVNLDEKIKLIPEGKTVIAIDAALGGSDSVGKINFNSGKLQAGKGVGKDLTPVGDFHVVGIVNIAGFMEYMVLQNTRLSLVMQLAREIVSSIELTFPLIQADNTKLTVVK